MTLDTLLDLSARLRPPPAGLVNVQVGRAVEGPGGRWVPCASVRADGAFVACLYEIGPGRRQVCADVPLLPSADEALRCAVDLAHTAAA